MQSDIKKRNFFRNISSTFNPVVCISFDFESSAQSEKPSFRSKLKSNFFNITNNFGLTDKDLSTGYGRGYGNRIGAEKILIILGKYDIRATWFCTGHVLMKGNENRNIYRTNKTLPYALPEAGFTDAVTWRRIKPNFYHDPFSNYKKNPYYYMGDLTEKIKEQGHDIQCHSFSHPYISMEDPEIVKADLEEWQNLSVKNGFGKSIVFAFPFLGDYHLIEHETLLKIIPYFRKAERNYSFCYLGDNVLKIFREAGFELFTRCGSMIDYELINGFISYRESDIFCMKDVGLLNFNDINSFNKFIEEIILKNATVDLWMHPNDIIDKRKYDLFSQFIKLLVKYRDEGKIIINTISETWKQYKEEVLLKVYRKR